MACGGGPHIEKAIAGTFVCQAGVEAFVMRRLTVGADVGVERYFSAAGFPRIPTGIRMDILLGWHFVPRESGGKWAPFLLMGWNTSNRNAEAVYGQGVVSFSAGAHYWVRRRAGLRFEFRSYMGYWKIAHAEWTAGVALR
ncbi:MAG: hypothetical protein N2036_14900 [Bryobacteraceae bacterium]|nr:hypothetical protein [Bryobacteraceae bacterium]